MQDLEGHKIEIYTISRYWFNKSKSFQKNDDFFSRFIYLWISFNTLYDFYGDLNNENEYNRICSTIDQVFKNSDFGFLHKDFLNLEPINYLLQPVYWIKKRIKKLMI